MNDFQLPDNDNSGQATTASKYVGNVPLLIEEVDKAGRAFEGVNIATGEHMRIEMANPEDFAKYFMDNDRFESDDHMMREAVRQDSKRPKPGDMNKGDVGNVAQMESVRELPDGRNVARWGRMITTDPEKDMATRAMVEVTKVRKKNETDPDKRFVSGFQLDQTEPATREAVDRMTNNKMQGWDGVDVAGSVNSQILVTVSDGNKVDTMKQSMGWDSRSSSILEGADDLISKPVGKYAIFAMAALAGRIGVDFDKLNPQVADGDRYAIQPALKDDMMAKARSVYDAAAEGKLAVAVTPGFSTEIMPKTVEALVKKEDGSNNDLAGRVYFEGDVGLRERPGFTTQSGEEVGPKMSALQVRPSEYLQPLESEQYSKTTVKDVGEMAFAQAEDQFGDKLWEPAPNAPSAGVSNEREKEAEQSAGYAGSMQP